MWSAPVVSVGPAAEPVTLIEAKQWLRLDEYDDYLDAQLSLFIAAARVQAEAVTGTRLMPQTLALRADRFADLAHFATGPINSVTAVQWIDPAGTTQTLAGETYELFGAGLERGVRPVAGASWPSPRSCSGAISLTVTAGYANVPEAVCIAILLMVGDLFAFRETAVTGTIATEVPMSMRVEALLTNHRIWLG